MKHGRIVVLGGTGFVGRHLVSRLAAEERAVVVATRFRERAKPLLVLPRVEVVELDVRDAAALAQAAGGADAVINLVGLLNESAHASFADAHVRTTEAALAACRDSGIRRYLHMSALNADPAGPSAYLRSKGVAEERVVGSGLDWTIFQPSVIFGPGDRFLNLFAGLAALPVVFLAGAGARFQPVYVGDVTSAFALALDDGETVGRRYQLGGPTIHTLRELVAFAGAQKGRHPLIVGLPDGVARVQAWVLEHLPGALLSRDNLDSMRVDSVCREPWPAQFGAPRALADVVPGYMGAADPVACFRQPRR